MVFGRNPNFPLSSNSNLPALEGATSSQVVANNLNAMHAARQAFIQNESNERLKRALKHQIRTSGDDYYTTGELVYYKRENSNQWHGPGTVIGQDGKQILVKHGSTYVRVHSCRLTHAVECDQNEITDKSNHDISKSQAVAIDNLNLHNNAVVYDTDSSEDEQLHSIDNVDNNENKNNENENENNENENENENNENENNLDQLQLSTDEDVDEDEDVDILTKIFDNKVLPKKRQFIEYKLENENEWQKCQIISRAGKVTGKYKDFYNILKLNDNSIKDLNWKMVEQWKSYSGQEDIFIVEKTKDEDILAAKVTEINSWKENNVYKIMEYVGQPAISSRWVITEKIVNGEKVIKARLVARGFEEDNSEILKDSPTCTKESMRLALTIFASNEWICNSIDIKSAFLQGKQIDRTVFLIPPPEFQEPNVIWKLNTCIYGLSDASRSWYLRVKEELCNLGVQCRRGEPSLFFWHFNNRLE
mgnify:CR=1 FL=1